MIRTSGILDGKNEILKFLNNTTDYKLRKYVEAGMPVRIDGGRWLAHEKNIEAWVIAYTRKRAKICDIETPSTVDDIVIDDDA